MMKVSSKMPSYWTFLNLHRLNSNSFTRWFFIEAITIGHYIYSANHIRTKSSNQNLLNFSGELESPPWKKTSLKVRRYPNMGFTTNLASGHYLSSMKTMILLRICFWPNSYTFDSSRSSIFPFKTILMSKIWLQCSCFRELVISTHHHKKQ